MTAENQTNAGGGEPTAGQENLMSWGDWWEQFGEAGAEPYDTVAIEVETAE